MNQGKNKLPCVYCKQKKLPSIADLITDAVHKATLSSSQMNNRKRTKLVSLEISKP